MTFAGIAQYRQGTISPSRCLTSFLPCSFCRRLMCLNIVRELSSAPRDPIRTLVRSRTRVARKAKSLVVDGDVLAVLVSE